MSVIPQKRPGPVENVQHEKKPRRENEFVKGADNCEGVEKLQTNHDIWHDAEAKDTEENVVREVETAVSARDIKPQVQEIENVCTQICCERSRLVEDLSQMFSKLKSRKELEQQSAEDAEKASEVLSNELRMLKGLRETIAKSDALLRLPFQDSADADLISKAAIIKQENSCSVMRIEAHFRELVGASDSSTVETAIKQHQNNAKTRRCRSQLLCTNIEQIGHFLATTAPVCSNTAKEVDKSTDDDVCAHDICALLQNASDLLARTRTVEDKRRTLIQFCDALLSALAEVKSTAAERAQADTKREMLTELDKLHKKIGYLDSVRIGIGSTDNDALTQPIQENLSRLRADAAILRDQIAATGAISADGDDSGDGSCDDAASEKAKVEISCKAKDMGARVKKHWAWYREVKTCMEVVKRCATALRAPDAAVGGAEGTAATDHSKGGTMHPPGDCAAASSSGGTGITASGAKSLKGKMASAECGCIAAATTSGAVCYNGDTFGLAPADIQVPITAACAARVSCLKFCVSNGLEATEARGSPPSVGGLISPQGVAIHAAALAANGGCGPDNTARGGVAASTTVTTFTTTKVFVVTAAALTGPGDANGGGDGKGGGVIESDWVAKRSAGRQFKMDDHKPQHPPPLCGRTSGECRHCKDGGKIFCGNEVLPFMSPSGGGSSMSVEESSHLGVAEAGMGFGAFRMKALPLHRTFHSESGELSTGSGDFSGGASVTDQCLGSSCELVPVPPKVMGTTGKNGAATEATTTAVAAEAAEMRKDSATNVERVQVAENHGARDVPSCTCDAGADGIAAAAKSGNGVARSNSESLKVSKSIPSVDGMDFIDLTDD